MHLNLFHAQSVIATYLFQTKLSRSELDRSIGMQYCHTSSGSTKDEQKNTIDSV